MPKPSRVDTDQLLLRVPFLADLEPEFLVNIRNVCERRTFPPGHILFRQGDPGNDLYIVASGQVEIYRMDNDGRQVLLDTNRPGDVFGELALVADMPRAAMAITVNETEMLTLNKANLLSLLIKKPDRLFKIIGLISQRLVDQDNRVIEELRTINQQLVNAYQKLDESYTATLVSLNGALDLRDSATEGHSRRVVAFSLMLGKALDVEGDALIALERGALLHDVGKIGVPDAILRKPGPLTDAEWRTMRKHPEWGAKIVRDIPFLQDEAEIVYSHHERWNGTGYPRGLKGDAIPLGARIFAIADVFDALVSQRPYKEGMSFDDAYDYIIEAAGIEFDPRVVDVFEQVYPQFAAVIDVYKPELR